MFIYEYKNSKTFTPRSKSYKYNLISTETYSQKLTNDKNNPS